MNITRLDQLWPRLCDVLGETGIERASGCEIILSNTSHDENIRGLVYRRFSRDDDWPIAQLPGHDLFDKLEEFAPLKITRVARQWHAYPPDYYPHARRYFTFQLLPRRTPTARIYVKVYLHDCIWFSIDTKNGTHAMLDAIETFACVVYYRDIIASIFALLPQPIAEEIEKYI